jgi:hypothetical protein
MWQHAGEQSPPSITREECNAANAHGMFGLSV